MSDTKELKPVTDLSILECIEAIKENARENNKRFSIYQMACFNRIKELSQWISVEEELPSSDHIGLRTGFLLKGRYVVNSKSGKECFIVSRLVDYIPLEKGIFFELPANFEPEQWKFIE